MGSPVPAARVPLSSLLSGCSAGTHNPPLCMLSLLGYLGSFPRRRKFRLEQNNSKHRCGHTCLRCPGPCPPAPTRRATQGRRGITQAVSRAHWQRGAWKWGVMEPLGTQHTPGHGGRAWALQQGAPRGTDGENPRSPGTSACSLASTEWSGAHREHCGSCPSRDSPKAASRAHITLSPTGTATAFCGPAAWTPTPSPDSPRWGRCLASPLHTRCQLSAAPDAKGNLSPLCPSQHGGLAAHLPCGREPGPGAGCLGGQPSSSFPT